MRNPVLRKRIKSLLHIFGLLSIAWSFFYFIRLLVNPELRRQEKEGKDLEKAKQQRFAEYKNAHGGILKHNLNLTNTNLRKVLISSIGFPEIEIELGLIKGFELAGFEPVVLIMDEDELLRQYYDLAGIKHVFRYREASEKSEFLAVAETVVRDARSVDDLLNFEYCNARVGRFAVATMLRRLRLGSLEFNSEQIREPLVKHLVTSMAFARSAQEILHQVKPDLAMFVDGVYTPEGELFDNCLAYGIEAISWDIGHKNNSIMFKRYSYDIRNDHPWSISNETWELLKNLDWTEAHTKELNQEFYNGYASGSWYSANGTQFNKRFMNPDEIKEKIGLNPSKKTAIVFPHILWDAPIFHGENLFESYKEWFIETVRMACQNEQVNWVIKIHPAHVGKGTVEGFHGEPAEVIALREVFGLLPAHIFLLPAHYDISTLSLFPIMDYCLTVRGTVGIEAARMGVPVLTGGSGRYSHKGFTIDSQTKEQYFTRLSSIQNIPPLTQKQKELADRFAYGTFMLRPLPLTSMNFEYHQNIGLENRFNQNRINIKTKEEWYSAPDLGAFAQWVKNKGQPDFLMPIE
ncbi:hypothetical protein [Candidatus Nitronereus thalassa]|uniref:Capsule polysaccharide biosynthesis protein n=1 Tax=Candidatus Nitronereus thalassa TaxID=3020898 RepID=A0ABU3K563_9BACT|nr:hypothetical protein [Candidatus Nitronereus thalassa]MDT7041537.1 hypothetical protein [Candidatus Nitronereus thalassa]